MPFVLSLWFDKFTVIEHYLPFVLNLWFDKLTMIGIPPPFVLSLSKHEFRNIPGCIYEFLCVHTQM